MGAESVHLGGAPMEWLTRTAVVGYSRHRPMGCEPLNLTGRNAICTRRPSQSLSLLLLVNPAWRDMRVTRGKSPSFRRVVKRRATNFPFRHRMMLSDRDTRIPSAFTRAKVI